jgi:hypothetical protein
LLAFFFSSFDSTTGAGASFGFLLLPLFSFLLSLSFFFLSLAPSASYYCGHTQAKSMSEGNG